MASGATELRVPVKPQPRRDAGRQEWLWEAWEKGQFTHYPEGLLRRTLEDRDVCPYFVGSLVALTETWDYAAGDIAYKADGHLSYAFYVMGWRPAITMRAEFSRFHRRVTNMRVEHGETWDWVLTLEEA
jgi:hypothetical protein